MPRKKSWKGSNGSSWPSAILRVDKGKGLTSHDVVLKVRRILRLPQVGHTGTLDPQASGLLLICIGNATRLSAPLQSFAKRYHATIGLGARTETDDAESPVIERRACPPMEEEDVASVLRSFEGAIQQVPPRYCALKRDGKPFYKRARAGEGVVPEGRTVHVHAITLEELSDAEMRVIVDCGSGTYLRSLARDVGEKLGCGGYLRELRRVSIGDVSVEGAVGSAELDTLSADQVWARTVEDTRAVLGLFPRLTVTEADVLRIAHGAPPDERRYCEKLSEIRNAPWVLVCDQAGNMIALASGTGGSCGESLKLRRVFIS